MGSICLMYVKLYWVCVMEVNVNYVGSIIIDLVMLEWVGLLFLEEVDIINFSNGNCFFIYVLFG